MPGKRKFVQKSSDNKNLKLSSEAEPTCKVLQQSGRTLRSQQLIIEGPCKTLGRASNSKIKKINSAQPDDSKQTDNNAETKSSLINEIVVTQEKLKQLLNQLSSEKTEKQDTNVQVMPEEINVKKIGQKSTASDKEINIKCTCGDKEGSQSTAQDDITSVPKTLSKQSQMENDIKNIAKILYKLEKTSSLIIRPAKEASMQESGSFIEKSYQPSIPQCPFVPTNIPMSYQSTVPPHLNMEYLQTLALHSGFTNAAYPDYGYPASLSYGYSVPSIGSFGNTHIQPLASTNGFEYIPNLYPLQNSIPGYQHLNPNVYLDPSNFMLNSMGSCVGQGNYLPF